MPKAEHRLILARVFKAAREHLALTRAEYLGTPKQEYICYAIDETIGFSRKEKDAAQKIVMGRLHGSGNLQSWLVKYGYTTWEKSEGRQYGKMQRTRLAWLNSLVAEFGDTI